MKGSKVTGIVLFIVGIVGLILSIIADFISIGFIGASPGFGTIQIIGTAIGAILTGVGLFLMIRK